MMGALVGFGARAILLGWAAARAAGVGSELSGLLVLAVHGHALTGKDVCEGALVAKLAVSLDEPRAYFLLLAWLEDLVGEGAGRACGARADLEKFAWNMGEVFGWEGRRDGFDKEGRGQEEEGGDVLFVEDLCLGPLSLSRSLSLSGASLVASGTDSWSLRCLSAAGILEREEEEVRGG